MQQEDTEAKEILGIHERQVSVPHTHYVANML